MSTFEAKLFDDDDLEISPRTTHLNIVEARLQSARQDSQMSLLSDLNEEDIRNMLRPLHNPLCEALDDPLNDTDETAYPSGGEDEDSWTTDSDADSWEENDDDSNDISFSNDPRYIDSGWGGECLRETEDIDFEFVYALHTFVATVEGQANATKGDTMVLLDDSNSYWWLVRVVKDSSIGKWPIISTNRHADLFFRLPTRRTHRNAHGTSCTVEQASEHRSFCNHAWRYG